jgi:nucleoside-diphosphate-sugar epimerase
MLTLLDISKAKKLLGWKPLTSLRGAVDKTVSWYTLNHKTAKDS